MKCPCENCSLRKFLGILDFSIFVTCPTEKCFSPGLMHRWEKFKQVESCAGVAGSSSSSLIAIDGEKEGERIILIGEGTFTCNYPWRTTTVTTVSMMTTGIYRAPILQRYHNRIRQYRNWRVKVSAETQVYLVSVPKILSGRTQSKLSIFIGPE